MKTHSNVTRVTSFALSLLTVLALAPARAESLDELFEAEPAAQLPATPEAPAAATGTGLRGSLQLRAARTVADPEHWSAQRVRGEFATQGRSYGLKWKLGLRADFDAAYVGHDDFYPAAVRDEQRFGLELTENYADIGLGDWELRLGKQHVVWGELIGIFVADVVSPRDLRDALSTDLDRLRRSQWAARVERFGDGWHGELVWVPVQTYDRIGRPGAEFYPYPLPLSAGIEYRIERERIPGNQLDNGSLGVRLGALAGGWDVAGFAYTSRDIAASFERRFSPGLVFTPVHDRIRQYGGTATKDFGFAVLRGEAVWTDGRRFPNQRLSDADGLSPSGSLDWAAGLDFVPAPEARLNLQFSQRVLVDHDQSFVSDRTESYASLLYNQKFLRNWEGQFLWAANTGYSDGWVSPSLLWRARPSLSFKLGADYYYGPDLGFFGRYDGRDRWYGEMRLDF